MLLDLGTSTSALLTHRPDMGCANQSSSYTINCPPTHSIFAEETWDVHTDLKLHNQLPTYTFYLCRRDTGCAYQQLQNLDVPTAGEDQILGDAALHLAGDEAGDACNVVAVLHHAPRHLQTNLHFSTHCSMLYFAKCKQLVLFGKMVQKPSHLHTSVHLSTDCRKFLLCQVQAALGQLVWHRDSIHS